LNYDALNSILTLDAIVLVTKNPNSITKKFKLYYFESYDHLLGIDVEGNLDIWDLENNYQLININNFISHSTVND
jgi:hypothetical protein